MARLKTLLLSFIVTTAFVSATPPTVSDPSTRTFQDRYAAMKAAMAARDREAISALLSTDFISEDVSGKVEKRDAIIAEVVSLPLDPEKKSETVVESVKVEGSMATVTQRYRMHTIRKKDGADHQVDLETVSTDTWVNTNGQWLIQKTITAQMDYSVDGKLVVHKLHP